MIKSVEIKAFRNIKNKVYSCDKKVVIISGNNTAGKTNNLNAIYWCLTGCDLEGSVNNLLNIPYGEDSACVKLVLDNGSITRKVNKEDLKTVVEINGEEYGSKIAENKIDELLGIADLAKKDTSAFKIRRFLINPNYYRNVATAEFRKWFLSFVFKDKAEQDFIKSSNLSDITKKLVIGGESLSSLSSKASKQIKALNTQINQNKAIQDFLTSKCITAYNEELAEDTKKCKLELLKLQELAVAVDEASIAVSKQYQDALTMNFGDVVLLEKGKEEDVWKEVCYPKPFNANLPLSTGSTAETILVSIMFIAAIEKDWLNASLPKLIDEGETLDKKSLEYLTKTSDSQLFITKVSFEKEEGVKIC